VSSRELHRKGREERMSAADNTAIGERIATLRAARGLSQADVA
jgi:hypothetical protein